MSTNNRSENLACGKLKSMSLGPFSHSCKRNASSGYRTDVVTGFALTLQGFPPWLRKKLICSSEILVTAYQTTWYQMPERREIKTEIHKYDMILFSFRVLSLPVVVPRSESSARSAGLWFRYKLEFDVSKHEMIHTAHSLPAWHASSCSTWGDPELVTVLPVHSCLLNWLCSMVYSREGPCRLMYVTLATLHEFSILLKTEVKRRFIYRPTAPKCCVCGFAYLKGHRMH